MFYFWRFHIKSSFIVTYYFNVTKSEPYFYVIIRNDLIASFMLYNLKINM